MESQKSEIFLFSILKFTNPFSEVPDPYSIFTHNLCCPSMRTRKLHYARACKNYARVLQKPENTAGCERLRAGSFHSRSQSCQSCRLSPKLEALGTRMELVESINARASFPVACQIEVNEVPRMTSINTDEEDTFPVLNRRSPCVHSSSLVRCACDEDFDDEDSPLISYQNHSDGSDNYLTDIHCHEAKPIYSNAKARRKLVVASFVCLLFVIAEVVGKICRSE